ncbi:MAG: hypothetical protein KC492_21185, partial [Myxococcales bacterium]|nr:hypothetical protein [Myxococcales bacterium]
AVASATREVRSSSLPAPAPEGDPLAGSALKLDALISEALSEPPPADPAMPAMTPLPISDQIPTLLDNSSPSTATTPLPAPSGGDVDELLALSPDALETAASPPNEPAPISDSQQLAEQPETAQQLEEAPLLDVDEVVAVEVAAESVEEVEVAAESIEEVAVESVEEVEAEAATEPTAETDTSDDSLDTRGSGVHPRPGGKVEAPTNRDELLAKLRERRLRKTSADAQAQSSAQSGSGTSSGT